MGILQLLNMSRRQQQLFIQAKDFEQSRFGVSPIDTDKGNKNQYLAYSRYRYPNLKSDRIPNFKFATGWIEMNQYGLPPPPGENSYTESEEARDHMRIPIDPDQEACVELGEMLRSMDEFVATNDALHTILSTLPKYAGKPKNLAKATKKYMLVPSYRKPKGADDDDSDEEEEEGNTDKKSKHDFCKMKIDRDWNTKNFTVTVFTGESEADFEPKTFAAKKVVCRNATELNEYVNYCCKVRLVVSVNKVWVSKSTGETGMYKYGLGMKIVQMQVIPRQGGQDNAANDFSQMAFIGAVPDDDDEEEVVEDAEEEDNDAEVEEEDAEEEDAEEEDNEVVEEDEEVVEEDEEVVEEDEEEEEEDADEEVEYEEVEVTDDEEEEEEEEVPEPPKKTIKKKKKKTKN